MLFADNTNMEWLHEHVAPQSMFNHNFHPILLFSSTSPPFSGGDTTCMSQQCKKPLPYAMFFPDKPYIHIPYS